MSAELDALTEEVTHISDVQVAAVAFIHGLADQIHDAQNDPAAIAVLTVKLHETAENLASAITANTPAAEPVANTEVANTEVANTDVFVANTEVANTDVI